MAAWKRMWTLVPHQWALVTNPSGGAVAATWMLPPHGAAWVVASTSATLPTFNPNDPNEGCYYYESGARPGERNVTLTDLFPDLAAAGTALHLFAWAEEPSRFSIRHA